VLRFLLVTTHLALRSFARNRLRTALTMLGVIIGVAAVIATVALGNGARDSVTRTMRSAGTTIVTVTAGNYIRGGDSVNIASGLGAATTLTRADAAAVAELPDVEFVAGGLRSRTWVEASADARFFTVVAGTEPALAEIHGWTWLGGRGLTDAHVRDEARTAVLGRLASASLFGEGVNPVGRQVTLHDARFEVVGWMRAVDRDQDEGVFVPVSTLQQLTARSFLQTISIGVTEAGVATRVSDAVSALLRERHGIEAKQRAAVGFVSAAPAGQGGGRGASVDDFVVRTQAAASVTRGLYTSVAAFALANMPKLDDATLAEMSGTLARAGTTMTALLASIAAISLVVGGIGIMNIMLVSVTERTREIGVRLAVGARRRDVLLQFLVEALMLSLIGGLLGIVAGIAGARALTALLEWPTEVSTSAILLAVAVSAGVGIGFGYYPARRASRLDPIEALRYE
jgi:putative ABC transport system permease protein